MKHLKLTIAGLLITTISTAQSLKPIFDGVNENILPSFTLVAYPKNTFLENIVIN